MQRRPGFGPVGLTLGPSEPVDWSVVEVFAGDYAFVAVDRTAGTAVCWGDADCGGTCPAEAVDWSVVEVFASGYGFVAVDRTAATAVCWGEALWIPHSSYR